MEHDQHVRLYKQSIFLPWIYDQLPSRFMGISLAC